MGQFSKNYRTFYTKLCHQALRNMGLGSGIRKKTYSGSRIRVQGSKRHRIPYPRSRIRNTGSRCGTWCQLYVDWDSCSWWAPAQWSPTTAASSPSPFTTWAPRARHNTCPLPPCIIPMRTYLKLLRNAYGSNTLHFQSCQIIVTGFWLIWSIISRYRHFHFKFFA